MSAGLTGALAANRVAIDELIAAAERCGAAWLVPRAPGKWSPSQVVEHVARSLDESAKVVAGAPSSFPSLPFLVRPLVRAFLFNRVLRTKAFPKARTNKAMDPITGPATPADGRTRLEEALGRFDRACQACAARGGQVVSATFGKIPVDGYAQFMAIHTTHHRAQMPA